MTVLIRSYLFHLAVWWCIYSRTLNNAESAFHRTWKRNVVLRSVCCEVDDESGAEVNIYLRARPPGDWGIKYLQKMNIAGRCEAAWECSACRTVPPGDIITSLAQHSQQWTLTPTTSHTALTWRTRTCHPRRKSPTTSISSRWSSMCRNICQRWERVTKCNKLPETTCKNCDGLSYSTRLMTL